jgi:hypothetical protein
MMIMEELNAFKVKVKDDRRVIWGLVISAIAGWGALVITAAQLLAHGG